MTDLSEKTKEMLEAERDAAREEARGIERRLDQVVALIGSARINIECCKAIMHLQRYRQSALSSNADPNQDDALNAALADISLAVTTADLLPF